MDSDIRFWNVRGGQPAVQTCGRAVGVGEGTRGATLRKRRAHVLC